MNHVPNPFHASPTKTFVQASHALIGASNFTKIHADCCAAFESSASPASIVPLFLLRHILFFDPTLQLLPLPGLSGQLSTSSTSVSLQSFSRSIDACDNFLSEFASPDTRPRIKVIDKLIQAARKTLEADQHETDTTIELANQLKSHDSPLGALLAADMYYFLIGDATTAKKLYDSLIQKSQTPKFIVAAAAFRMGSDAEIPQPVYEQAIRFYTTAAERNHVTAVVWLHRLVEEKKGTAPELLSSRGLDWCVNLCSPEAIFTTTITKLLVSKSQTEAKQVAIDAVGKLTQASEAGLPNAQLLLAHIFSRVQQDQKKALKWYLAAADNRLPDGMYGAALCILDEFYPGLVKGGKVSLDTFSVSILDEGSLNAEMLRVEKLLKAATTLEHAPSFTLLALIRRVKFGGLEQNKEESEKLLQHAALKAEPNAINILVTKQVSITAQFARKYRTSAENAIKAYESGHRMTLFGGNDLLADLYDIKAVLLAAEASPPNVQQRAHIIEAWDKAIALGCAVALEHKSKWVLKNSPQN